MITRRTVSLPARSRLQLACRAQLWRKASRSSFIFRPRPLSRIGSRARLCSSRRMSSAICRGRSPSPGIRIPRCFGRAPNCRRSSAAISK